MCITAHFHNGHRRQVNRLIAFRVIEGSHTGGHLAETFFEVMEEFGIVHKVMFWNSSAINLFSHSN
jgi:hypothetical protein